MSIPKILFINNTSRLGAGTSQSLCLLLDHLMGSFEVSVVLDRHSNELPQKLSTMGIPYFTVRDRTLIFFPQLVFYILSRKIDLVYANSFCGRSKIALWASKITHRPFIWHIRESFGESTKADPLGKADVIIANSTDTADRIKKYAHVKQVIVVPNGVELSAFQHDKKICHNTMVARIGCDRDALLVINMGRLCDQKNQSAVVTIANETHKKNPNVHFIFLGSFQDALYVENLKQQIKASLIPDNYHLIDFTDDFIPTLMGCHILLHTALREPQGRVVLEAMAAKIPVVAYNVGGVGEAVMQDVTGYLHPLGDYLGMAADLQHLIDHPSLRVKMGLAGYQRVHNEFTAEKTAAEVKKVINSALIATYQRKDG